MCCEDLHFLDRLNTCEYLLGPFATAVLQWQLQLCLVTCDGCHLS